MKNSGIMENAKKSYFDYNATTPVHPDVVEIMNQYMLEIFGNPGSVHSFGLKAYEGIDYARAQCGKIINADKDQIIFTSGGTESDNLAIQSVLYDAKRYMKKAPHLITCMIEHPAVYNTAKYLKSSGFESTFLDVNNEGFINLDQLQESIKENTKLISIMYANNEIGTIQPIRQIGKIAHDHGIIFHTDAVQAITKTPIDVKKEHIDLLSVSAHKFYGPKGVGFLFAKDKSILKPLIFGGSQEYGLRPATQNTPGIVGLGKAIEIAMNDFDEENSRLKKLQEIILNELLNEPEMRAELNGPQTNRISNNINIRFEGIDAYDLMNKLDKEGIAISVGAACHATTTTPSRVLLGIGLSPMQALSSIRISIGRWTTKKEIKLFLDKLKQKIREIRAE